MARSDDDVPVTWLNDVSPAAWIGDRLHPFAQDVGSIAPQGFERYLRLFHPVELGDGSRQRWSDVARRNGRVPHPVMQFPAISTPPGRPPLDPHDPGPSTGCLPLPERRVLVERLKAATTTPDRCWFCVWDGWGFDDAGLAARVELPGRSYLLYGGAIETALAPLPHGGQGTALLVNAPADGAEAPVAEGGTWPSAQSPNLWWPEDRAWFVATEIDAASTYVGGPERLIRELLAEPALEAFPCQLGDGIWVTSDAVNV